MPNLNLESYRLTLVFAPVDGRCGYDRLAAIGRIHLGIDVDSKRDALVFVSRRYGLAKIILRDATGRTLITRWLDVGRFERFLMRDGELPISSLSKAELMSFLDGKPLQNRPHPL